MKRIILSCVLATGLTACGGSETTAEVEGEDVAVEEAAVTIPDSLAPFGDGYPNAGDPCRRLGESALTVDYLDDSAVLVGCPTEADAEALGGTTLSVIEGITVVSVPTDVANEGMPPVSMEDPVQETSASAQKVDGIEMRRVSFASGANSARLEGSITGSEIVDYVLNVRQGQPMNISMASQNSQAYFNIMEPGETNVAMFIGSTSGNQFEGVATKSGDYRIRVYLMRAAARRDETADYGIEMIVG